MPAQPQTALGVPSSVSLGGPEQSRDDGLPSLCLCRLLQLQHRPATPPGCPQAPQLATAPCLLPSTDSLLVPGIPLLPALSPVASAARLLDTQLHISPSPAVLSRLAAPCEPVGLPPGDCEMQDVSSSQLGTFVLVQ